MAGGSRMRCGFWSEPAGAVKIPALPPRPPCPVLLVKISVLPSADHPSGWSAHALLQLDQTFGNAAVDALPGNTRSCLRT